MRTTVDLVKELNDEASKFWVCAICVGFESSTTFVFSNQTDQLERLNDAVNHGGEPVGLIGMTKEEGVVTLCSKPLQEHAGEGWVESYLTKLLQTFATAMDQKTFETGGWIN